MRNEKVLGHIGLGLFCLFPLLGLLQMRDPDDLWRGVAERTRPTVVILNVEDATGHSAPFASGVLLQSEPRLLAVTGRCRGRILTSRFDSTRVGWRVLVESPEGDFAVLVEDAGPTPLQAALFPGGGTTAALPDAEGEAADTHEALLVGPETAPPQLMFVGVLSRVDDGFAASELRRIGDKNVDPGTRLDPLLEGAPFVDADGTLLALYGGMSGGRPLAVPIQRILVALDLLGRQVRS